MDGSRDDVGAAFVRERMVVLGMTGTCRDHRPCTGSPRRTLFLWAPECHVLKRLHGGLPVRHLAWFDLFRILWQTIVIEVPRRRRVGCGE